MFRSTAKNHSARVPASTQTRLIERLRALRKRHGLTQEQFAEVSGLGYKHYQQIEIGMKRDLRLSTIERLARAYGIEVHQLLAPESPPTSIKPIHCR